MSEPIVTSSPDIVSGTPVFAGTRVPVQALIDYLEGSETIDDFLTGFPTVRREQVVAFFGIAVVRLCYGLSPPWRAAFIACVAAFAVFGIGAVVPVITRVAVPFWALIGAADAARRP